MSNKQWVFEKIDKLISEVGSQGKAAKLLGISGTLLSQIRNGKYLGDVDGQLADFEKYFRNREAAAALPSFATKNDYVPTSTSENVYQIIRTCQLKGGLALVFGDAGVGKTKASLQFVSDNPSLAVYISTNSCLSSIKEVLISLCLELGLSTEGTQGKLFRRIYKELRDGMVIIIDEAQDLSKKALNTLRAWTDQFSNMGLTLGITFVGNYELLGKFASDKQEFQQLRNRQKAPLRPFVAANMKLEDIHLLFPDVSDERSQQLLLAVARSQHAVRDTVNLYDNALNNENTSYEGLVAMCKAMGITRI